MNTDIEKERNHHNTFCVQGVRDKTLKGIYEFQGEPYVERNTFDFKRGLWKCKLCGFEVLTTLSGNMAWQKYLNETI